jgi:Fe-Mn family superoxide dismutase
MVYAHTPLPYGFAALEPAIDAKTMEIHHGKHLAAYVQNLNAAIGEYGLRDLPKSAMDFVRVVHHSMATDRRRFLFNLGGVANHEFFFAQLGKGSTGPDSNLASAIGKNFGSFGDFQKIFQRAALDLLGSGWVWLTVVPANKNDGGHFPKLEVLSTRNHDNPLMAEVFDVPRVPILCLDMWEHAYYLNYQNRKGDYIAAFWSVVDWGKIAANYAAAMA